MPIDKDAANKLIVTGQRRRSTPFIVTWLVENLFDYKASAAENNEVDYSDFTILPKPTKSTSKSKRPK